MKMRPKSQLKYREYVAESKNSAVLLAFVLDNAKESVVLDYSSESLALLEALYWKFRDNGVPSAIVDVDHFIHLIGQYLGEAIIQKTGAKWVLCIDQNPMFGQPMLDHFGNAPYERVYPVQMAITFYDLPKTNPHIPGVEDRRVFAFALEKAVSIRNKSAKPKI